MAAANQVPLTPPTGGIVAVDAFPGLSFPNALCLRSIPGETNRLFVVERNGIISYIPDIHAAVPERRVMLNIRDRIAFNDQSEGEEGLLSFAFHPKFATNGYIYVFYMASDGTNFRDRLSRFTVTKDSAGNLTVNNASELILINQYDRAFSHNAGDTHFGPYGYLYVSLGDEGDQMNRWQNAQHIDRGFFSGVIRIDVDKNPTTSREPNRSEAVPLIKGKAGYSVPESNPFVRKAQGGDWDGKYNGAALTNYAKVRTELWATGLRSPWRMAFDTEAPYDLWLGDVGQDSWEEVNVIERGKNYGWAFREGFHQTPGTPCPTIGTPPKGFVYTDPVWEYPHPATTTQPDYSGQSITGGVVYHGRNIPELTGAYICADFRLGNIWSIRRTTGSPVIKRVAGDAGIAAFGLDPSNGDVLMANYTEGKVKRLILQAADPSAYPVLLSQTGLFKDLATLTPADGVTPYDINLPFWSDHAQKQRWFSLPAGTSITMMPEGAWSFPTGTVWVKHFDMEMVRGDPSTAKRLETRVLVRTADGAYGVSYRWNDAGTEANLVGDAGETFDLPVTVGGVVTPQTWEIPSRTGCMLCHTPVAGYGLGFNPRQLDRAVTFSGQTGNQIELMKIAGYLAGQAPVMAETPHFLPATEDGTTLEFRVRSFLAANCVQCHQQGGAAPASWDARPELTLEETGLIGGMAERGGTNPLDRLIVPGQPEHSILLKRLQASGGFTRMPPLGTHVFDQEAIDLVTKWVTNELPQRQLYSDWQSTYYGANVVAGDPERMVAGVSNYDAYLRGESPFNQTPSWRPSLTMAGGQMTLNYLQKAHRGYLIEASDNMADWSLWQNPANFIQYRAADNGVQIPVGAAEGQKYYRFRISEE